MILLAGEKSSSNMEKNPAGYFKLENWKNPVQIDKGMFTFIFSHHTGLNSKIEIILAATGPRAAAEVPKL